MKGIYRTRLLAAVAIGAIAASAAQAQDQVPSPAQTRPSDQPQAQEPQVDGSLTSTPSVTDAPAQQSGDIVVTGTRGALENAERTKRDSSVLIDGFSADDIGALPDASIAESLVRIPGLTSNDRENGFEQLSIRGLGPDLAQTLYNGRVFPAPSLVDRRVNLGDIPTEGVGAAAVQKTADAATIQGGVAGTILIQSFKPLETSRRGLTVVARAIYGDISNDTAGVYGSHPLGFRTEVAYINKLTDNLGVALDYAYIRQSNISPSVQLDAPRFGTTTRADINADGIADGVPMNVGTRVGLTNQNRHSLIGMLQWDVVPNLRLSLDGLYINDGGTHNIERFFATGVQNGALGASTSSTVVNNSLVQFDGQVAAYREILHNDLNKQQQKEVGFNAAYDGDVVKIKLDLSYSQAGQTGVNRQLTTENDASSVANQRINVAFDVRDRENATVTFQPLVAEDYALTDILLQNQNGSDTIKAGRLDFDIPLEMPLIHDLAFGVYYSDRIKQNTPDDTEYSWPVATATAAANYAVRPDLDSSYLNVANNPFINAANGFGGRTAAIFPLFDVDKVLALRSAPGVVATTLIGNDIAGRFRVDETAYSLYMQANLKAGPVTGNIGVRYVITDDNIQGFIATAATTEDNKIFQQVKRSYENLLPTLNLKYAITETLAARFAYGKTLSPPTFTQQRVGTSYDPSTINSNFTVSIGNPDLKPFTADNLDASLEWYPNKSTSLVVQSFSKFVRNYIEPLVFAGSFTLPDGTVIPNATINTTVNDPGTVHFRGIEVIGRRDFNFLPGFLRNLGVVAHYTHNFNTDANVTVTGVGQLTTLVMPNNFTQDQVNAQLYYSERSLDLRLAYRAYSHYLRQADNGYQIQPSGKLDFSGSIALMKNVRLTLNATNLTNAKTYEYFPDARYPSSSVALRNTIYDGRKVTGGFRVQF